MLDAGIMHAVFCYVVMYKICISRQVFTAFIRFVKRHSYSVVGLEIWS